MSPDVPPKRWPRFAWNPGLDPSERLLPPTKGSVQPASDEFFDALRIDVRGPRAEDVLNGYVPDFLGWVRQLSRQPWIGEYEPQTDVTKKYSFRCDAEGRAIDSPWALGKAATFANWMRLISPGIWREAVTRAAEGITPDPYWSLFLDAQIARAVYKTSSALLSLALALEVARDQHFTRFARTETKDGVGEILGEPFSDTDLLKHLSTRLQEAHPNNRTLKEEHPPLWTHVESVYVARHHIAHGGPAVVLGDEGVRPATDADIKEISDSVHDVLVWIENL